MGTSCKVLCATGRNAQTRCQSPMHELPDATATARHIAPFIDETRLWREQEGALSAAFGRGSGEATRPGILHSLATASEPKSKLREGQRCVQALAPQHMVHCRVGQSCSRPVPESAVSFSPWGKRLALRFGPSSVLEAGARGGSSRRTRHPRRG